MGVNSVEASTESAAFDQVTKIDVTLDKESTVTNTNATITKSGIVALLADQYSALHTIKSERVASQRFNIENLLYLAYQNRDMYVNNLAQNAVVFTLEANDTPTPSSVVMMGGNTRIKK